MPLNWQAFVANNLSVVGKLVHLAMRQTQDDATRIQRELTKVRRRAYEQELTIQAELAGCSRQGKLTRGPALSAMSRESREDSKSIINTYNHALAVEIKRIRTETPTANRNTYVKRLRAWENKRLEVKSLQIAQWTEGTARARAQRDFYKNNGIEAEARVMPKHAAEEVCAGWIARGWIDAKELLNNPPPYHTNCPHVLELRPKRVPKGECADLWIGE